MFCEALQSVTVSYIVGSNVTIKVGCYTRHIYFLENILVQREIRKKDILCLYAAKHCINSHKP